MKEMRWFVYAGLAASLAFEPAVAQRRLPWTYDAPVLELGQRVRVSTWEPGFSALGPSPFAGPREVRLAGTLVAYSPLDSVRVARTGPFAQFSASPERTVYWSNVSQIDVPNGRNTLDGMARGLGGAFGLALLANLGAHAFGCNYSKNCPNVWKTTAQVSLVTVPAGAVYGFFSTRWKRVY
jgi:hypothetical protein